ncbi:MAG: chemotaxis protein CheD [Rhizobacter sp.]|nr:chemotaxis protein CheD [Bacteriovorax sp.]
MKEVHVKIAEVHTGTEGEILRATLGSCIGIAFIWREQKLCGLAHCFLPETEEEAHLIGAKYVNQAILSLMKIMKIKKEDINDVEVYLAGAGNMMNQLFKSNSSQIGKNNEISARKYLQCHGFKIKEARLGYNSGSKILVNCSDFTVEFIKLDELNLVGWKAS